MRAIVIGAMSLGMLSGGPEAAELAQRVLQDDWGRTVRVDAPPRRIVSMAPHATELLAAVGVVDRMVAVDPNSDQPPAVRRLPKVAAYPSPDLEALAALKPDLVVLWGAGLRAADVARIESLGIEVFVSDPRRLPQVADSLARLSLLADDPSIGQGAARDFAQTISMLDERHRGRTPVRVFVQLADRPLMTLTDRDSIGDALRLCGAVNVFGASPGVAVGVDAEAVLASKPSLILAIDSAAGREPWNRLGVLEPAGIIRMARIDASIQRPGPRLSALVSQLCDVVDAVRKRADRQVSGRTLR